MPRFGVVVFRGGLTSAAHSLVFPEPYLPLPQWRRSWSAVSVRESAKTGHGSQPTGGLPAVNGRRSGQCARSAHRRPVSSLELEGRGRGGHGEAGRRNPFLDFLQLCFTLSWQLVPRGSYQSLCQPFQQSPSAHPCLASFHPGSQSSESGLLLPTPSVFLLGSYPYRPAGVQGWKWQFAVLGGNQNPIPNNYNSVVVSAIQQHESAKFRGNFNKSGKKKKILSRILHFKDMWPWVGN